jgi:hypothetical protein
MFPDVVTLKTCFYLIAVALSGGLLIGFLANDIITDLIQFFNCKEEDFENE